jgi:hypothetical protein
MSTTRIDIAALWAVVRNGEKDACHETDAVISRLQQEVMSGTLVGTACKTIDPESHEPSV